MDHTDNCLAGGPCNCARELQSRNPWVIDPDYPLEDWKYEVQNGDTRLGYHDWVDHKKESDAHDQNTGS